MSEHGDDNEDGPGQIPFDFRPAWDEVRTCEPVSAERMDALRFLLAMARELGHPSEAAEASMEIADDFLLDGDLVQATSMAQKALAFARECGTMELQGKALLMLGRLARRQEQHSPAEEFLREAAHLFRMTGEGFWHKMALVERAESLKEAGELAKAVEVARELPREALGLQECELLLDLDCKEEALQRVDELIESMKRRRRWVEGRDDFYLSRLGGLLKRMGEKQRHHDVLTWRLEKKCKGLPAWGGRFLLELAELLADQGLRDEAGRHLTQALALLGETEDGRQVDGLMLAAAKGLKLPGIDNPWLAAFKKMRNEHSDFDKNLVRLGGILFLSAAEGDSVLIPTIRTARRQARRRGDLTGEFKSWLMQAALEQEKDTSRALRSASRGLELARRQRDPNWEWEVLLLRARVHLRAGNKQAALRAGLRAQALIERLGHQGELLDTLAFLAPIRLELGQLEAGGCLVRQIAMLVEGLGEGFPSFYWRNRTRELQALLLKAAGKEAGE